jgi:hypothetical protein
MRVNEIDRAAVVDGGDTYIEDVTWNGAPLPTSRIVDLGAEGQAATSESWSPAVALP